jgi:uncharacterized UBP type Zn finger protein
MNTGIDELITRIQNNEQMQRDGCTHLKGLQPVAPGSTRGCEDCLKIGDTWTRLRICLVCGHIGCCDNSKNKHARRHFEETDHAMVLSFEPRELWMYCFADDEIYIAPE